MYCKVGHVKLWCNIHTDTCTVGQCIYIIIIITIYIALYHALLRALLHKTNAATKWIYWVSLVVVA